MEIKLLVILLTSMILAIPSAADNKYANPIVRGDWSDPGLIRVGDDYYSMRSSFGWKPGVPITHSKDLLNWEYIGYAYIDRPDIKIGNTGGGCWGSEIGYNPNNGTYLIYIPMGDMDAYVSKSPGGPYTGPYGLHIPGIDPGFFADDDGRLYLTSAEGKLYELNSDGLSVKEEVCNFGAGAGMDFEGPDIFKHNGYYYCLYSSGGTRPHQISSINTIRAKNIRGPWESDPNNPNMQANDDTGAVLQGPAHGTLVDTPDGQWFVSYHAFESTHYSLGRQMCMEPIEWTQDGWWRPVSGRVPSINAVKPNLPTVKYALADSDEFDQPKLGLQWFFHTKPDFTGSTWSLAERPGYLRITTQTGDISSPSSLANVFLQRVTEKKFEISTKVEFDAKSGKEAAGLHMYHDPGMNFWLVSTVRGGRKIFEVGKYNAGKRASLFSTPNTIGNTAYLKIRVDGNENATFYYSRNGQEWAKLGGSIYFGDSWHDFRNGKAGDPDLGWVGLNRRNVWTGTVMGVFAVQDEAGKSRNADFDWFRVSK